MRTLLRENPECVNARDDAGRTPLHYPYWDTRHGEEMIELLIAHGADTTPRTTQAALPSTRCCKMAAADLAEVLRRHGGDSA